MGFKSRQSVFKAHPLTHNTQLFPSVPHRFIAQMSKIQEWVVVSYYVPLKCPPNHTYPDRWAASTGYWRTSHSLGLYQAMGERAETAPLDSRTLWECQGKATGLCVPAGGNSQEQSCQMLPSTWSERKIQRADLGRKTPIRKLQRALSRLEIR